MRRIIPTFFFIACLFSFRANSQDTVGFTTIEAKTYEYYLAGNWDSVIYYGKQGLSNNIDYFYLRVRLGAAYYYKQNYSKAITEFNKALKYNSSDTYTQTMLYSAYLLSERENDARYFGAGMNDDAKKSAGFKKSDFLNSIYFEGGINTNNNIGKNENKNFYGNKKIYGEAVLTGNIQNEHLGLRHNIGKRFSVYHGFTLLQEDNEKIMQSAAATLSGVNIIRKDTIYFVPPPPVGGHYNHDTIFIHAPRIIPFDTTVKYKNVLNQFEYYINCKVLLAKGLTVTPYFHLLNVRYTVQDAISKKVEQNYTDTIYRHTQIVVPNPFSPPMVIIKDTLFINYNTHKITTEEYHYPVSDTVFNNYALGLSLNKNIRNLIFGISGTFSKLNGNRQKMMSAGITWFPMGNLNLYGNTTVTAFQQNREKINIIADISAGIKVFSKLWLETFGTIGEISNYSEANASVVYNNPDRITFRCGLSPIFVFKRFDIALRYQYQERESNYTTYIDDDHYTTQQIKYQCNFVNIGLKWKL